MATKNRPLGWTTIEESMALIKAGLSSTTADMYYLVIAEGEYSEYPRCGFETDEMPCWSFCTLWKLLPKDIDGYSLEAFKSYTSEEVVAYSDEGWAVNIRFASDNLMDSVVKMVLWCLSNGYIKKK